MWADRTHSSPLWRRRNLQRASPYLQWLHPYPHPQRCWEESDYQHYEPTLLPIIQNYVAPGTTIITDKWKAYINLQNHGYVHLDVNHSQNFVDPESGAHTNRIEGTWTHVKNRAQRRGGRRSPDHLARDLTEFMWLRQKGLLSSADRARLMFARELPQLLNFQNFVWFVWFHLVYTFILFICEFNFNFLYW